MAYEAKFAELSRFPLELTEDEAMKTKRFVKGLRPYIRSKLVPLNLRSYSEAIDRAILVEEEMKDTERIIGSKSEGQKSQETSGSDDSKKPKLQAQNQQQQQRQQDWTQPRRQTVYFGCGRSGHVIRDCSIICN